VNLFSIIFQLSNTQLRQGRMRKVKWVEVVKVVKLVVMVKESRFTTIWYKYKIILSAYFINKLQTCPTNKNTIHLILELQ